MHRIFVKKKMASNLKQPKISSDERPTGGNPRTGGRGMYCCIPECGISQYDRNMNKTNIALFSFPNKETRQLFTNLGVAKYKSLEEKVGKDGFTITKSTKVCELHFKPDEIKTTLRRGIKTLKTGVEVPSIYSFKKQNKTK